MYVCMYVCMCVTSSVRFKTRIDSLQVSLQGSLQDSHRIASSFASRFAHGRELSCPVLSCPALPHPPPISFFASRLERPSKICRETWWGRSDIIYECVINTEPLKNFTPPPPNLQSLDPRQLTPHARVGALVVLALQPSLLYIMMLMSLTSFSFLAFFSIG